MPPRFLCEVISIFSIKIWYCKICKKCYQITNIQKISENIVSNIIETISGDRLNESSIKATVEDMAKKNIGKYL